MLQLAHLIAGDLLKSEDRDDDGIPLLQPLSCGREGHPPVVIRLPALRDEARKIAELLSAAHEQGTAWGDMAILCRRHAVMYACASALRQRRLPHEVRKASGDYHPRTDTIKVMTMHACKGLEFPVVALPGVGTMPEAGEAEAEEARLFYVAATRATDRLILTLSGDGSFAQKLSGYASMMR